MQNKLLVGVDAGKHTTKAVIKENKVYQELEFRTKLLQLTDTKDLEPQGNSYKVSYNNKSYILGDMGEEIEYDTSKTHIVHKLAVYNAITQFIQDYSQIPQIQLVVGCPINTYKNKVLKQEFKQFLFDEISNIKVNDQLYKFKLDNILIMPESSGVVYYQTYLFDNKRLPVIDLGGRNMNFAIYNNLAPEPSSMFSNEFGGFDLEKHLINELNSRFNKNLSINDIQTIINNGCIKEQGNIIKESIDFINNIIDEYIVSVRKEIKRNGFDLDSFENVVFIGGTSELLKDQIQKQLKHSIISADSRYANVKGFYEMGAIKYGC